MARADYLDLRFGATARLKRAHLAISLLGVLAVLISPGSWEWRLSALSLLAVACIVIYRLMGQTAKSGSVRIFKDDTAMLSTETEKRVFATLAERHWVSPWICSVAVYPAKGGPRRFLVVDQSDNDADEYRRLLRFLRMRPGGSKAERMIW